MYHKNLLFVFYFYLSPASRKKYIYSTAFSFGPSLLACSIRISHRQWHASIGAIVLVNAIAFGMPDCCARASRTVNEHANGDSHVPNARGRATIYNVAAEPLKRFIRTPAGLDKSVADYTGQARFNLGQVEFYRSLSWGQADFFGGALEFLFWLPDMQTYCRPTGPHRQSYAVLS